LGNANYRPKYSTKDNKIGVSLEFTSEEKDLGIWIEDKLKVHKQGCKNWVLKN